jgi:hypothetical protein
MPPTPLVKAAAERAPATRTSSVSEGVEALSQMVKTTRSTQQRRPSSTGYTPIIWRGDVTLPGARRGGGSPAMGVEIERALWPNPTAVRQQLILIVSCWLHMQQSGIFAIFVKVALFNCGQTKNCLGSPSLAFPPPFFVFVFVFVCSKEHFSFFFLQYLGVTAGIEPAT